MRNTAKLNNILNTLTMQPAVGYGFISCALKSIYMSEFKGSFSIE